MLESWKWIRNSLGCETNKTEFVTTLAGATHARQYLIYSLKTEMEILSYERKLTCNPIYGVTRYMVSKRIRKHIKELYIYYLFEILRFEYIKVGLKGSKTCTYLRKWLHVSSLSKKKQKEKGNKGYMPCWLSSGTCLVSGFT